MSEVRKRAQEWVILMEGSEREKEKCKASPVFKGSQWGQRWESCPDAFLSKQHLLLIHTETSQRLNTNSLILGCQVLRPCCWGFLPKPQDQIRKSWNNMENVNAVFSNALFYLVYFHPFLHFKPKYIPKKVVSPMKKKKRAAESLKSRDRLRISTERLEGIFLPL